MSNYLIELAVIHIALVLGYWCFLRKEREYARMRFYLIASTLLALTIPLLKLPKLFFNSQDPVHAAATEAISTGAITFAPTSQTFTWSYDLLVWVYVAVSAFLLAKLIGGMFYLLWLAYTSRREKLNDLYIRRTADLKGSFTFFNWIFLNNEIDPYQAEYEMILKHEKAHASLGHTYDLLFFELFKACFWWLPTGWIIIKEIKKIHEYQADAAALRSCDVDQYSSVLISSALETNGLNLSLKQVPGRRPAGLTSSFHDGLILKRLIAMKQHAKKMSPWKLVALSALCTLLFIAFACSEEGERGIQDTGSKSAERPQVDGGIFTVVEKQPEFEGGLEAFHKYISSEIRYPLQARQAGIEGRVDVQFVIEKNGSLAEVKAIKGIGSGCDEEAVRVLQNSPPFQPGTQNGKPVRVRMVVPITFRLNKEKTNPDNSTQGMVIIAEVQPSEEKFKVDAYFADGHWSGTVYDENGNALPGVNLIVFGTTTGTVSGMDGTFKVKADQSGDLVASFIGYETVRLKAK